MTRKEHALSNLEKLTYYANHNVNPLIGGLFIGVMRDIIAALPDETIPPIGPFLHDGARVYGPKEFNKVYLMEAMEEKLSCNPTAIFRRYSDGGWWWKTAACEPDWQPLFGPQK